MEWARTMEDGVPCLSFSVQIPFIWADSSVQNLLSRFQNRSDFPGNNVAF